jgi:hypothetical protein
MLAPGIPSAYQDFESASLFEVAELIRHNYSIRRYSRLMMGKPFSYEVAPENHRVPVMYPSPLYYNDREDYFYPQVYYYAVKVDIHEKGDTARNPAREWRDRLFKEFPQHVRLAYVGPTHDCVYLICQGKYNGSREFEHFLAHRRRDQERTAEYIRQNCHNSQTYTEIQPCDYCYLSFDAEARWRTFINDRV